MSKVYFSKEITKENLLNMYKTLGKELKGRVQYTIVSGKIVYEKNSQI